MSVSDKLYQTWEQLRGARGSMSPFLTSLGLKNVRGLADLQVSFDYPVSVLAGPNGCGKTTVLQACYCAYQLPGKPVPNLQTPAIMFPSFKSRSAPLLGDELQHPQLKYQYKNGTQELTMLWHKPYENWIRDFLGRAGASQPERAVYLRSLAHLSNPTEVRVTQMILRKRATVSELAPQQLALAQRLLPFSYHDVKVLTAGSKELLIASRDGLQYSEFHMSASERVILHLAKDLSLLHGALVLIEEVETGLHPTLQQQLMLELQGLASSNNLQIIVSSHSTVILDCVPAEARIVLDYDDAGVVVRK